MVREDQHLLETKQKMRPKWVVKKTVARRRRESA